MGHTHFGDEEEEVAMVDAGARSAPPQPAGSASLPVCCGSLRVDSNRNNPSYVFKTACNATRDAAVASTSDNIIKAFSLQASQLAHVCDFKGHTQTISDVMFTDPACSSTLHSSSHDGTVRGWDCRSGQQAER